MILSIKTKYILLILLIILNITLRIQIVPHEIGVDSFLSHIKANAISEFGYAKWFLNPLSVFGLSPFSYTSSVPFLISGIHVITNIETDLIIYLYSIFLGLLGIFTAYLMAGAISKNDLFKFFMAFVFSVSPAILVYTTWTMPTRALLVILSPILIYLLLKSCKLDIKYLLLSFVLSLFLFATHHLFYFLLPMFVSLIIVYLKNIRVFKVTKRFEYFIIIFSFILMLSMPLVFGKFLEQSKYDFSPIRSYIQYTGPPIIFALGGLTYIIFKDNKKYQDWIILFNIIFLTALLFKQTYMKWMFPVFIVPFICIGILNFIKNTKKKYILYGVAFILLITSSFSGYYQFLHLEGLPERHMDDATYKAGIWMREETNGSSISNQILTGYRLSSISETAHVFISETISAWTYGFVNVNLSKFKYYPITSEEFWYDVGKINEDPGELLWQDLQELDYKTPRMYNISYIAEDTTFRGLFSWHHGTHKSSLLLRTYDTGQNIYDSGSIRIWKIDF